MPTWIIAGVSYTMTDVELEIKLRDTAHKKQKIFLKSLRSQVNSDIDLDEFQEATDRVIRNVVNLPRYHRVTVNSVEGFLYVKIRNRLLYLRTTKKIFEEIDETTDVQKSSTYDNDMVSNHFDSNCFKRYKSLHRNRMNAFRLKYMFKYGSSVDDLILLFGLRDDTKGRNLASQKKKRLVENYTTWLFKQYADYKGLLPTLTPAGIKAHVKDILYGRFATPVTKDYKNWILKHCI